MSWYSCLIIFLVWLVFLSCLIGELWNDRMHGLGCLLWSWIRLLLLIVWRSLRHSWIWSLLSASLICSCWWYNLSWSLLSLSLNRFFWNTNPSSLQDSFWWCPWFLLACLRVHLRIDTKLPVFLPFFLCIWNKNGIQISNYRRILFLCFLFIVRFL